MIEDWGFQEDRWPMLDRTQCEDFPPWIKAYWKFFEGASDEFLVSRRCNVSEPIDFPIYHVDSINYDLLGRSFLVGIFLFLFRIFLTGYVIFPVANKFVNNKAKITNFCESIIKALFSGLSWAFCVYVLYDEPYFMNPTKFMDSERFHNWTLDFPREIFILYYVEMGWYFQSLVTHFTHDSVKKDSFVMFLHHVVTLFLLYASHESGYMEFPPLVLFSMDLTDSLLEIIRAARYISFLPEWVSTILFIPLPICWVLLRLWFFSRYVLIHCIFIMAVICSWQEAHVYFFFNILLVSLLAMNLYWFFLISRIAYRKVITGVLKDSREKED